MVAASGSFNCQLASALFSANVQRFRRDWQSAYEQRQGVMIN
jgi:hypothetical protein